MSFSSSKAQKILINIASKYALPLLLGAVVMNIIFKTYMGSDVRLYTFGYIIYECLLFAFFEFLKPKKIFRGLVYTALCAVILFLSINLLRMGYNRSSKTFIDWFYLNSQDVGRIYEYFYFLFIGLGFFIISVLYYFTVVRYRSFGTMLVLLFPFFIYGKRADSMETIDITLMLTVFLALMVHSRLVSDENQTRLIINKSYAAAAALFVTLAGALAMLIPLPEPVSYLENNKNFFDVNIRNNSDYSGLGQESSPRFGADSTGEILFNFTTTSDEQVIYLRRQSFDIFRNEKWIDDESYNNFSFDPTVPFLGNNEVNSPAYVYSLMKKLADTGKYESYGLKKEDYAIELFGQKQVMNQFSDSFAPIYIPAPLMIEPGESNVYSKTVHGEVYRAYNNQNSRLGVSFEYIPESAAEQSFAKMLDIDGQKFRRLIYEAASNGDLTNKQYTNLNRIYALYIDVSSYNDDGGRIAELAQSITKDCKNDYEKAVALVDYFENNSYEYDNEYEPEDTSIDYFLFDSKTGNCTSFATSMTLMARMSGLPSRYVEGFAAYEKNENGEFVVRDSHAHAFVEVFIAGVGWMTFDPTVSGYQQDFSGNGGNFNISTFVSYFSKIALFIGVVFVLVFIILLDRITELLFRISLMFSGKVNKVLRLYRRVIRLLEISSHDKLAGYTPQMLSDYMSAERGAQLDGLVELFEKTCFGGHCPTDEEWDAVYKQYRAEWKKLVKKSKIKMRLEV